MELIGNRHYDYKAAKRKNFFKEYSESKPNYRSTISFNEP